MGQVRATATQLIEAPVDRVRAVVEDYPGRSGWLPAAFSDVRVGEDGSFGYRLSVGRRVRDYRMRVSAGPNGPLERDVGSTLSNTWELHPESTGTRVRLTTEWRGAGGIGGFFERIFAPQALVRLHLETLARLAEQCR